MPIPAEIVNAAATYRQNGELLVKTYAGLTPEEWLRSPSESCNHLTWIVGHIIWARGATLGLLGSPWTRPWFPLFGRGSKLAEPSQYPSAPELEEAWQDVSAALTCALNEASSEALSAPAPERIPAFDGKLSGTIGFLAFHESYHVGQAAYLRSWLGHGGVAG